MAAPLPPGAPGPVKTATWPWQRSLQLRILLAYGAVFLVVLALLILWIGNAIYRADLASGSHDLEVTAFLAANALQDPLSGFTDEFDRYRQWQEELAEGSAAAVKPTPAPKSADDEGSDDGSNDGSDDEQPEQLLLPRLQQVADAYAADDVAHITILDPQGNALADSHTPAQQVANQGQQAEFRAALNDTLQTVIRTNPVDNQPTVFAAAPIRQNGSTLGVVQISKPVSSITADARQVLVNLGLASLLALVLASAVAFWIGRRLVKPLADLEEAAIAVAGGDLTRTVPMTSSDELGMLSRAFNYMVSEVRTLFAQQRAFVANASHELRTPLTNIRLRSEALLTLEGQNPELQQRYLQQIEGEADRLTRLANNLLDLSRLEEEPDADAFEPVDLAPTLRTAVEMLQLQAHQAGLTLTVDIPPSLPPVRVDADDVEAILVNLVENAIKYTPRGGHVQVSAAQASAAQASTGDGPRVELRVQDNGPGIPPEDMAHIFDRFYRVDKARSRRVAAAPGLGSGAGLGLSIVHALVRRNGGQIVVFPAPEQGVVFVVSFAAVA